MMSRWSKCMGTQYSSSTVGTYYTHPVDKSTQPGWCCHLLRKELIQVLLQQCSLATTATSKQYYLVVVDASASSAMEMQRPTLESHTSRARWEAYASISLALSTFCLVRLTFCTALCLYSLCLF